MDAKLSLCLKCSVCMDWATGPVREHTLISSQNIYPGKDLWAACRCRSSGRESSLTVAHYSQSKLHISLYKFQIKSSLTERLSMGIVPAPRIFKVVVSYPPTLSEKWLTVTCHRLAPWTLMSLNWNGTIWCSEVFHENSFTLINLNGESCYIHKA